MLWFLLLAGFLVGVSAVIMRGRRATRAERDAFAEIARLSAGDEPRVESRIIHPAPRPNPAPRIPPPSDSSLRYAMEYVDFDGVVTNREIAVRAVEKSYDAVYVIAFCQLRNAMRTFRAERIRSLRSMTDGKEIDDPAGHFSTMSITGSDAGRDFSSVMSKARNGLQALVWIANADREMSERELDIMMDFVESRDGMGRQRPEGDWNRAVARIRIAGMAPTLTEAAGGIARMGFNGRERALVEEAAARLVDTEIDRDGSAARRKARLFGIQKK